MPGRISERIAIRVAEEIHVARARQEAQSLANHIGFPRPSIYSIATSASELAGNLFFHTEKGGIMFFLAIIGDKKIGIEMISEDNGPGIPDVELAMRDGYSSSGGLGGGLPGVQRLMDEFEIESTPGVGTRIKARKWIR